MAPGYFFGGRGNGDPHFSHCTRSPPAPGPGSSRCAGEHCSSLHSSFRPRSAAHHHRASPGPSRPTPRRMGYTSGHHHAPPVPRGLGAGPPSRVHEVFSRNDPAPFSKVLTFYRKGPFQLEAFYSDPTTVPYPEAKIGLFVVQNVAAPKDGEKAKVKVKVRVNTHGIFTVSTASVVERMELDITDGPVESDMDPQNPTVYENSELDKNSLQDNIDALAQSHVQTDSEQTPSSPEKNSKETKMSEIEKGNDKKGDYPPEAKKAKIKVKNIELPVEANLFWQLGKDLLNMYIKDEGKMIMQDKLEKERNDAKNAVEEYVYEFRDKLSGPYGKFAGEKDLVKFTKLLTETEEWLYEEGEDQPKEVYVNKLDELKKLGTPIQMRYKEAEERPRVFGDLGHRLQHFSKILEEFRNQDEKYNHIDVLEMEKVEKCVAETMAWMNNAMNVQAKQCLASDPVVHAKEIKAKEKELDSICNPIVTQSKPKVESPKEEKMLNGDNIHNDETSSTGEKINAAKSPQHNGDCHPNDKNTINMDLH